MDCLPIIPIVYFYSIMLPYPDIDPIIFQLGPLQVRWYGLMYLLGFGATWFLVRHQIRKFGLELLDRHFENLTFVLILGLILGARLGFVFFYHPGYYLSHPFEILAVWQGGLSFHGGLLGLVIGGYLYCWVHGLDYWRTADVYTVTAPIGLGFGRIGNFINGELYGRVTDVPWGMVFPGAGPLPRHPSQLYEAFLEGAVLFGILWWLKDRRWPSGSMLAFFLIFYGLFRSVVEFFREPDAHLGFVAGFLTMGQVLSLAMMLAGGLLLVYRLKIGNPARSPNSHGR
jgi:phosphatidylglycerol---prolipoprotein diacylglyceryl transferase